MAICKICGTDEPRKPAKWSDWQCERCHRDELRGITGLPDHYDRDKNHALNLGEPPDDDNAEDTGLSWDGYHGYCRDDCCGGSGNLQKPRAQTHERYLGYVPHCRIRPELKDKRNTHLGYESATSLRRWQLAEEAKNEARYQPLL